MKITEILKNNKPAAVAAVVVATVLIFLALSFILVPDRSASPERFVISIGENKFQVADDLKSGGFIKSTFMFDAISLVLGKINPGGYKISKSMNIWQISLVLSGNPYMKWVIIPEGLRKEEIADILSKTLGWNDSGKKEWLDYTGSPPDYFEGVYFPDTYLIPTDETPADTAKRLTAKFQEKFAPYAKEALAQDIRWTTALKIASLIQREAAGKSDMPLISGIIWNRLNKNMPLDVDATLQYARGDTGNGFWAPAAAADKKIISPYNTYLYTGLPPHPISNPGLVAIDAAINPQKTTCLYYLHDSSGIIHCSDTYAQQKQNVEKYLKI